MVETVERQVYMMIDLYAFTKLVEEIEKTRYKMITAGMINGFTHKDTIKLSVKLDQLLNEYLYYKYKQEK